MALSIIQCPKTSKFPPNFCFLKSNSLPLQPTFLRFSRIHPIKSTRVVCAAFSAAGTSGGNGDVNPYEVLGVNPVEGFDMVKAAYTKKRKDAERRGDEAAATQLEKAYDKIMMSQLTKRKKGETYGSFRNCYYYSYLPIACFPLQLSTAQVSKDIKYADKQPIVPWGPRFAKSEIKDVRINMAISAVFTAWIFIKRSAEYKPLQFLAFVFVYRMFEKLKGSESPASLTFTEEGEDEGRMLRMGKRLLRSLALVFGCVAFASVGYTGVLNVIEFAAGYIPIFLYNNQLAVPAPYQGQYFAHRRSRHSPRAMGKDVDQLRVLQHRLWMKFPPSIIPSEGGSAAHKVGRIANSMLDHSSTARWA
ncbi:hypothetical protein BUALT_Bualt06G0044300 [Buddleja alternifolia]|uniref:Uncharacterized protein n=1 Tax=Buddleja alternifolia TaxID=168488 RepID=A0AAV6XCC3_9LAMI|nr:hypothetical protein BUALT_Bualt06G0044300 [Buddleja alternifolia]